MATSHVPRTVVLVHGAFHGAWCWAGLQAELERLGIPSFAIDLPGHGTSLSPLTDLHGDADHVAQVLAKVGGDGDVVLVGHSYGGAVISQADLGGRVSRLVYLSALVLDDGEDPASLMATFPAPPAQAGETPKRSQPFFLRQPDGTIAADPALGPKMFYNTCSAAEAQAAVARLCPQRAATFKQPATRANWRTVPSTFVRCLQDNAVPVAAQDGLAKRCTDILDLDTDHSPFLGAPAQLANLLAPLTKR